MSAHITHRWFFFPSFNMKPQRIADLVFNDDVPEVLTTCFNH